MTFLMVLREFSDMNLSALNRESLFLDLGSEGLKSIRPYTQYLISFTQHLQVPSFLFKSDFSWS